jgi:predicted transcriptional regulator
VKFSSQADPELLTALRALAKQDGRHFQAVLEDAMRNYIEARRQEKPRAAVMAHFRASLEKNRELVKLLAE